MEKKTQTKKMAAAIIYADFLAVMQEALAMASDMPRKFRMTVDSTFQQLSLAGFQSLTALKRNRDQASKEVVEGMMDCVVNFQVFFETAAKMNAVAEGRFGKFIENSEFVLKKLKTHGKAL